jgi:hypothetical protein
MDKEKKKIRAAHTARQARYAALTAAQRQAVQVLVDQIISDDLGPRAKAALIQASPTAEFGGDTHKLWEAVNMRLIDMGLA